MGLVKFGHMVFEIRERTDRQTDKLIEIFRTHTDGKVGGVAQW